MKLQSINSFYFNRFSQNKVQKHSFSPLKADSLEINFKGLAQKKLQVQAFRLEKEAMQEHREANEIKYDSYQVQAQADKIQKTSVKITKEAKAELKKALISLKQGQQTNHENIYDKKTGEIIREFYEDDDDDKGFIMRDYDDKGYTTRKVVDDGYVLKIVIPDYDSKDSKVYMFDKFDNELISYIEGINLKGGSYGAQHQFTFANGKITTYDKNYKYKEQKGETSEEHFSYSNGSLVQYCADWSLNSDGSKETAQERYIYKDKVFQKAQIGYEDSEGEYRKIAQEYVYDIESGFKSYLKGFLWTKESSNCHFDTIFSFTEEGLERIYTDVTTKPKEKRMDSAQMFLCVNDKPKKCAFNYSCIGKIKEIYSKLETIGN